MQAVTRTACFARCLRQTSISAFIMINNCRRMSVGSSCLDKSVSPQSDTSLGPTRRTTENDPRSFKPQVRIGLVTKAVVLKKQELEEESKASAVPPPEVISKKVPKKRRRNTEARVQVNERPTVQGRVEGPSMTADPSANKPTVKNALSDASPSINSDDADEATRCLWLQAPNPPLPLSPNNPHPVYEGINANAAAIAYLRAKGLASHPRKRWFFYLLCWVLRHAARDLGFAIAPDGFVRIFDLLRFEPFQRHTIESFAQVVIGDQFDRFEVITLPDVVDGEMRDVWWVRARASHSMPGVEASNKRIINMGKLQTVAYRAPLEDWQSIQKYGIREDPTRVIPLHQIGGRYFGNIIPGQAKYICITIDAQQAAKLGVTFFHTFDANLLAVGRNGVIPIQAIRSVVKLDFKKEKLL